MSQSKSKPAIPTNIETPIDAAPARSTWLTPLIQRIAQRFGRQSREVERFIKFIIIGGLSTAVDFAVLNVLQATILPPIGDDTTLRVLVASLISYMCGLTNNYLFNRYWAYPDARQKTLWVQLSQFVSVYLVSLGLRGLLITLLFPVWAGVLQGLLPTTPTSTLNRIGSNLAAATTLIFTTGWNFIVNRLWTFGEVEH